ncbi:MAG: hypothetical protein ACI8R8_002513 [Paraglaciecola sp.]|jgi:hypothetical protein
MLLLSICWFCYAGKLMLMVAIIGSSSMSQRLLQHIQGYCDDPQLFKQQKVQSLWSGYGEVARYYSPRRGNTVIVKQVNPRPSTPHPRGWHSSTGHQRKLTSYVMEGNFYHSFARQCNRQCKVPDLIAFCGGEDAVNNGQQILVMEDLHSSGFTQTPDYGGLVEIKLGIRWLAHFHGRFLAIDAPTLWPIGSYWHLGTRQDEYARMPDGALKSAAPRLDQLLNRATHQTLIHGDAKLANFCFTPPRDDIAAVDFQYVGKGVGVKDLMYFLGSCLNETQLFTHYETLLTLYFSHLRRAVNTYQVDYPFVELEQQWRALCPVAWADFQRFLQGWSPGHNKINLFMAQQTRQALATFC